MALSGSYDFAITRDEVIREAYELLGSLEEGQAMTADEVTTAARKLNLMTKAWVQHGYHLWALQDAVLFLVKDEDKYSLGSGSTDAEWCAEDDYNRTTLSAAEAAGSTALDVTSTVGIAVSDRIGIVLDDGTIFWTTVSAIPGTVTIAAGLPSAAASGNYVFSYTSRPVRPLKIVKGTTYWRDPTNNDTPVELLAHTDYTYLSNKLSSGTIVGVAYQPFLTSGILWMYQPSNDVKNTFRFTYERPLQDLDIATNNPDLPIEWGEAFIAGLAVRLAPTEGAISELEWLVPYAADRLQEALDFDTDNASVKIQPRSRWQR